MNLQKSKAWILLEKLAKEELSIRELANMMDLSRTETVRRWHKGIALPDYNNCIILGKIFNVNPGELYAKFRNDN